ncbi:hypothetical protein WA026_023534 [Henosepilachna vigintioctopunctata]|uniref:Uncharacterized protein n=1 Tax=Henosepilachna vigintioctopunctata TaxID=420089 RepID=A0AAW1TQ57_9CUCU
MREALFDFLVEYCANDIASIFLRDKKLFVTNKAECYSYEVENNVVVKSVEDKFACDHEEADTRIIYHLSKLEASRIAMVKASDTDILVIILGNIHKLEPLEIFLSIYSRI